MKQIYHPYTEWEELAANMWGDVDDVAIYLQRAIEFTGDSKRYGGFMRRVVAEWPVSCENALTNPVLNKKAWIGHAACAMALGCPEDLTRKAWGYLSDEQRVLANKEAARAIHLWERSRLPSGGLYDDVGRQMLFDWDT